MADETRETSNLDTGIKTIIVETDENTKKSLQARISDNDVTFVKELKSVAELIETDSGIKNVLFELKSFKDKDTGKDAALDLIWDRAGLLTTLGKAVENDINVGILIENPDASFNKFFETLKNRYEDISISTEKKMSISVKSDDLKTVIRDQLDGEIGDVSVEDKEKMLKSGKLVNVINWPYFLDKIASFDEETIYCDTKADAKTDAHVPQ